MEEHLVDYWVVDYSEVYWMAYEMEAAGKVSDYVVERSHLDLKKRYQTPQSLSTGAAHQ